jgi:hypothetical protein
MIDQFSSPKEACTDLLGGSSRAQRQQRIAYQRLAEVEATDYSVVPLLCAPI